MNIINETTFLSTGMPSLSKDLFSEIHKIPAGEDAFKPCGGFYASIYDNGHENVCDWVNYCTKTHIYSPYTPEIFSKSVIFNLKNNANIFMIEGKEQVIYLSKRFPSLHHKLYYSGSSILKHRNPIDYESMAQYYDGIFVNINKLPISMLNEGNNVRVGEFAYFNVNTLLLFNLDCINNYHKTILLARLASFTDDNYCVHRIEETPMVIDNERSNEYYKLEKYVLEKLKQYIKRCYLYSSTSYLEYINKLESFIVETREDNELYELFKGEIAAAAERVNGSKRRFVFTVITNIITNQIKNDRDYIKGFCRNKMLRK